MSAPSEGAGADYSRVERDLGEVTVYGGCSPSAPLEPAPPEPEPTTSESGGRGCPSRNKPTTPNQYLHSPHRTTTVIKMIALVLSVSPSGGALEARARRRTGAENLLRSVLRYAGLSEFLERKQTKTAGHEAVEQMERLEDETVLSGTDLSSMAPRREGVGWDNGEQQDKIP
ncbi:hypothetical protein BDN72DRAFT_866226 [Pluteus cervinus]|uniref:Uncharacterized protein n=1 Tax=Pluteus cervinus TaxID=181527 RepID=A0ACD2ZXV3_9AGAR|nr:hypothetical protein BDN72DRAFT_866226 [Pluteus cervinus]